MSTAFGTLAGIGPFSPCQRQPQGRSTASPTVGAVLVMVLTVRPRARDRRVEFGPLPCSISRSRVVFGVGDARRERCAACQASVSGCESPA
jgi:hypothetical protein